jgi:two-component system LytT family response regulator
MTLPIRTIIVDGEPLARNVFVALLERDPEVTVVQKCDDAAAAMEAVRSLYPHLIVLSIDLPEASGLELIRAIGPEAMPPFILIGKNARGAVDAFDFGAVDYLVEPFPTERFERAIVRAKRAIRQVIGAPEVVDVRRDEPDPLRITVGRAARLSEQPRPKRL